MTRLFTAFGLCALMCCVGCSKPTETPPAAGGSDAASKTSAGDQTAGSTDVDLGLPAGAPASSTDTKPMPAQPAPATSSPDTSRAPTPSAPTPDRQVSPPATAAPVTADGVDLSPITQTGALAILVRPAQALQNPLVQGIIQEAEQATPDFKLSDRIEELREQAGLDVNDVEYVLIVLDQEHLALVPMLLGGFMLGDAQRPADADALGVASAIAQADDCFDDAAPAPAAADSPGFDGPPPGFVLGEPPPPPTVVIKFQRAPDVQKLLTAGGAPEPEQKSHSGQTYYLRADGSAAWFKDGTTAVMLPAAKIESFIDGQVQAGPLATSMQPLAGRELALALDVRTLHEFIGQAAQGNPMAAMVGGLVKQVNTLTIGVDLQGPNILQVQMHAINDGSAAGLQGMLGGFLQQGQTAFAEQVASNRDHLQDAEKELLPIVEGLVHGATLTAEGSVCSLMVPRPEGLEKLPELLRPAIQKAREQAAAAQEMNSLRQIALAFHNYHDVYGGFPAHNGPGVADAPGKGLSWRVHLLPFLEEYPLYQEFNLDEPWDSEHNKALIGRMPKVFGNNPEGKTSVHLFVGEGAPFQDDQGLKLFQVTDGTSNTILCVEAGPEVADFWTKPGGLSLKADDPVSALGTIGEKFLAAMMDGSVHRFDRSIDASLLKNLIQLNDGNPVKLP